MDLKTAERIARGEDLRPESERFLEKHRADKKAARARRRSRSPRASGPTKADRKKKRNEGMKAIREAVMERAGGRCELCGTPATEAHHLISGPLRRARESVDTVIALCTAHHLAAHRGGLATLEALHLYCDSAGMYDATAALAKRIDKIHEARTTCRYGATVCTHAQCRRSPSTPETKDDHR